MTDERAIEILDPEHREHYESIEPVEEACRIGIKAIKRVKELEAENAALRERLSKAVELPCKVGETVYEIIDGEIRETEVIQLKIDNMGLWITIRMGFGVSTVLFNKVARIYLTREAAETRLKELQGGER